jgi:hypothetical protein
MIQINLLKNLETVSGEKSFKPSSLFSKKRLVTGLFLFVAVAAAVVGVMFWPSGDKQREKPEIKPGRETSIPQKHMSEKISVKEVVKEIQTKNRKGPRYTRYRQLTPAEKIAHQQATCKRALTFLKKVKLLSQSELPILPGNFHFMECSSSRHPHPEKAE